MFLMTDAKYWLENGRKTMLTKSKMQLKTNHAKNVIIFLGDGMSLTTLTAARIYKAQMEGKNKTSESDHLSFEQFPFTGISKVILHMYYYNDFDTSTIVFTNECWYEETICVLLNMSSFIW